jgi:hypothetical protein
MFFANNFCPMGRTKISVRGLLYSRHVMHTLHQHKFRLAKPPGVGSEILFVCFFVFCDIFALAYRPHGLICKNFLGAVLLMATGSSARAMTFSTRGHVGRWGLHFGVKISVSEMHGIALPRGYECRGRCSSTDSDRPRPAQSISVEILRGGSKPVVVFRSGSPCVRLEVTMDPDCLRVAQSVSVVGHIKDHCGKLFRSAAATAKNTWNRLAQRRLV